MNENPSEAGEELLRRLLCSARPVADLPPGFEAAVWGRVERRENGSPVFLERVAAWVRMPRVAAAALAVVLVLSGGAGAIRGVQSGEREARARYVASVAPAYLAP